MSGETGDFVASRYFDRARHILSRLYLPITNYEMGVLLKLRFGERSHKAQKVLECLSRRGEAERVVTEKGLEGWQRKR